MALFFFIIACLYVSITASISVYFYFKWHSHNDLEINPAGVWLSAVSLLYIVCFLLS